MSPHIHIGPESVLAAHALSPPAAGSRCPAGADSAPHSEQNFFSYILKQKIGAELHIYLQEGTYHKRMFRGPNTNDMKK